MHVLLVTITRWFLIFSSIVMTPSNSHLSNLCQSQPASSLPNNQNDKWPPGPAKCMDSDMEIYRTSSLLITPPTVQVACNYIQCQTMLWLARFKFYICQAQMSAWTWKVMFICNGGQLSEYICTEDPSFPLFEVLDIYNFSNIQLIYFLSVSMYPAIIQETFWHCLKVFVTHFHFILTIFG